MKTLNFLKSKDSLAAGAMLLLLVFVTGCANNAVVFTTMTRTGVEINAAEGGQQSAHVGFDRFEGVLMPLVFTNSQGQAETLKQAYPVYAEYEFASGGLTPASATNGGALILRQVFATGKAATKGNTQKNVEKDFKALQGSYVADGAGDQLRCFWKPDGTNINPANAKAITDWMGANNVPSPSITFFLRNEGFADLRKKAVTDLQVPPCNN
jgi:hypothetical protein